MPRDYKIKSVLICDDVRQEISGKEILIGVYNDVIVFTDIPTIIPKLAFRIAVSSEKTLGTFKFRLEDPSRDKIIEIEGQVGNPQDPKLDPYRTIGIVCAGLPFSVVGTYRILLGIDRKPELIWDFVVRGPRTDEEKRRLQAPF